MKLPPVYKNIDSVKWTEPEEFNKKMIRVSEKIIKKEYKKFYRIGSVFRKRVSLGLGFVQDEKSYLWYDKENKNIYFQIADYYPKELWIKMSDLNNPSLFQNKLNEIKTVYFKEKEFSKYNGDKKYLKKKALDQLKQDDYDSSLKANENEKFFYIGLVPKFALLEQNIMNEDPFTQGDFLRQGTEMFHKHDRNKLTVIETKHSHSKLEFYFFEFVKINEASPCYIRLIYQGDTIPLDVKGTLSLLSYRPLEEFKKEVIKSDDDIDWSILLPGLVTFDSDTFIEYVSKEDFLNNKPQTNKLLSIVLDMIDK